MRSIAFDTTAPRDARAEMAYIFAHQWRFVQSKFYDPAMHGVDWPKMRDLYARYLPHISHWEDFAELMAEIQGELNASHMFSSFQSGEPYWDEAGMLGVYYDRAHEGPGVRIAGVLPGGPAGRPCLGRRRLTSTRRRTEILGDLAWRRVSEVDPPCGARQTPARSRGDSWFGLGGKERSAEMGPTAGGGSTSFRTGRSGSARW
jgi:hypothetical protein